MPMSRYAIFISFDKNACSKMHTRIGNVLECLATVELAFLGVQLDCTPFFIYQRRKSMKKFLSVVLSLIMLSTITTGVTMTAQATSITQAQAVSWANSQIGKSLDYDGSYGAQCVDLIKYYYAYLGVTPVKGNGCDYATNALPSGWQRIAYSSGFAAQPGDIAVWTYSTSAYGHVAIVTSASTSTMNVVEQNASTGTRAHSYSYSYGTFYGVIRPNFSGGSTGGSNSPQGTFDIAEGKCGSVYVGGWAFDKDDSSKSLSIHVYIGGPAGSSGAEGHAITANAARSDVNSAYGISGNHGYGSEITTNKTGSQSVYVYAINVGGGDNTLLGSKTVNISNPNPVGALDIVEGKCGQVFVRGWAFDPNDTSKALSIHVYVGAGSTVDGGEGHAITANTVRNDVNSVYKCGTNHGYSQTISTKKSGTQTVYVYAINIGSGSNVLLGSKTATIKNGHSWDSGAVTKSATCSQTGTKTYKCTVCGATKTETIAKKAHTVVKDEAVAPTCTESGLTEGGHCSVCGTVITEQKTIAATGHISDEGTVVKEPTYTETGLMEYRCSVCDELLETETIAKLPKEANTMVAKGKTKTVKYATLKKKSVTIARKDAVSVTKAKGKVTYKKSSGNSKITVSSAGKITVKKGLKKGTYKVKVKVKAAGNATYKSKTVTRTVTIKVK